MTNNTLLTLTLALMKNGLLCILLAVGFMSCETLCNEDLRLGQILEIPLDLRNYPDREAEFLWVVNVNGAQQDTSFLRDILFTHSISSNNAITDEQPDGYYSSNLDGSSLYFFEYVSQDSIIIRDSMTNIIIKKSQKTEADPCYADDLNIQIDELSFTHDGLVKGKGDVVVLNK
jgi:hypothetical protein